MKKTILTLLVAMMALMFSGRAGCDRVAKSIGSDVSVRAASHGNGIQQHRREDQRMERQV